MGAVDGGPEKSCNCIGASLLRACATSISSPALRRSEFLSAMSALTLTVSTSTSTSTANTDRQPEIRRHARYWLEDGSLVVRAQDDYYKVHRTLLHRHSEVLAALGPSPTDDGRTVDGLVVVHIPDALEVRSADFEALLEHLYHDA